MGACGGNYSSPSGVIYSPDFPDKYGAGRVCYWTVQVPGSSAILFNFTFFDISDQTDMVELLDGYTNQVVARFDGRSPPRGVVNITGDFVILYFYSDRTNQARGFALLYRGEPRLAPAGPAGRRLFPSRGQQQQHLAPRCTRVPALAPPPFVAGHCPAGPADPARLNVAVVSGGNLLFYQDARRVTASLPLLA